MLNGQGGAIQILHGKSKAARRILPLIPAAHTVFKRRHAEANYPEAGWVFPSGSVTGHVVKGSVSHQHWAALQGSGVKPFPVYTLRHTALTRLTATRAVGRLNKMK